MEKEALLETLRAVGPALRHGVSQVTEAGHGALKSGVRTAGSAAKLLGGLGGALTFVAAAPQMAAQGRRRYDQIESAYRNQGGV